MKFETALNKLQLKYQKYGFTKEFLKERLEGGVYKQGFSVNVAFNGLRLVLAQATGEHEEFSLEDIMEITGETKAELLQRIEQYREGLAAAGENPDEYFVPVEPMEKTTFYFPHGIPLN